MKASDYDFLDVELDTSLCRLCTLADIELNEQKIYGVNAYSDGIKNKYSITCSHFKACQRAYELGSRRKGALS